jgi:hypothetical protein
VFFLASLCLDIFTLYNTRPTRGVRIVCHTRPSHLNMSIAKADRKSSSEVEKNSPEVDPTIDPDQHQKRANDEPWSRNPIRRSPRSMHLENPGVGQNLLLQKLTRSSAKVQKSSEQVRKIPTCSELLLYLLRVLLYLV